MDGNANPVPTTSEDVSMSMSSSSGPPASVGSSPSCRRPPRSAWFIYVTKTNDEYDIHIGYKNSTGDVSEYCPTPNSTVKIPFGTPVKCEHLVTRDSESTVEELQFTSKRRDVKKFKISQLNSFEGGDNLLSKKITSMVMDKKEKQLAHFLSLLPYSAGFSMHRADLHSKFGELLDDLIDGDKNIEDDENLLNDFKAFIVAATESAKVITRETSDIRNYFGTKRKTSSESGRYEGRKSKASLVNERENVELHDNAGLEKEYQQSFVGLANIPLENINIAADLVSSVNSNRVNLIMKSMLVKYDPSLTIPVVCPEDGQMILDLKNVKNCKFSAIQKIHAITALKKLDTDGKFCNLISHKKRMVPCYVMKMSSSGLIHYGNMRSNDITYQFSRKTSPQDLIRIFHSLSEKEGAERAGKIIERMASLARIGPNEYTSLRKLTSWKSEGLKVLLEVLTMYESYESMDKKPKGFQKMLFEGKKMTMPNELFRQLGRMSEIFFLSSYKKILNSESSLKSCLDDFEIERKLQNVTAVLSILAEHVSYEDLKLRYPGKFDFQQLKDYFGAEIKKDGKKNKDAERLERYYEYVVSGEGNEEYKVVEISSIRAALNDPTLTKVKIVTVDLADEDGDEEGLQFLMRRANQVDDNYATIVLFSSETSQQRALSFLRTMLKDKQPIPIIKPLFFDGYERCSDYFLENLRCGVLEGIFSLSAPLKMYHETTSKLLDIIEKLDVNKCEVAVITDKGIPVVQLHSACQGYQTKVTYYSFSEDLTKFKASIQSKELTGDPSTSETGRGGEGMLEEKHAEGMNEK